MSIKIDGLDGLDDLQKQLKKMEKNARELSKTKQVSFGELFTASFMQKYTPFSSIGDFLEAGGFKAESPEDFEAIPDSELNKYIATTTKFKNWDDMLDGATTQYISQKLGF